MLCEKEIKVLYIANVDLAAQEEAQHPPVCQSNYHYLAGAYGKVLEYSPDQIAKDIQTTAKCIQIKRSFTFYKKKYMEKTQKTSEELDDLLSKYLNGEISRREYHIGTGRKPSQAGPYFYITPVNRDE